MANTNTLDRLRTLSVLADAWEETGTEPDALRANVAALAREMGLTCHEPHVTVQGHAEALKGVYGPGPQRAALDSEENAAYWELWNRTRQLK